MIPKDETQSLARHALTGVGLLLVQLGVIKQDGIVEALAGIAFIVAGLVWIWLDKRAQRKQLAAAKAELPPGASYVPKQDEALVPWCGKCRGPE